MSQPIDRELERVNERLIERAIVDLRRVVVGGQVAVMVAVGKYVRRHFFLDNSELVHSRLRNKSASLRRLALRAEEFGLTARAVMLAIPISLQVEELGEPVSEQLGVSQHIALLTVRSADDKAQLAKAATHGGWTVNELRKRIDRVQKRHAGGRKKQPRVKVLVDRATRLFERPENEPLGELIEELSPVELKRLIGRVNHLRSALDRIEKLLTRTALRGVGR